MENRDEEDIPKILEEILEEVDLEHHKNPNNEAESSEALDDLVHEKTDNSSNDSGLLGSVDREIPVRLVVGGMLQNIAEEKLPKVPTRVPARIETRSKDSFVLHIEESATQLLSRESLLKVSTIVTKSSTELPPEVAKAISSLEKLPVKVVNSISVS
jgi:hypothetical protein